MVQPGGNLTGINTFSTELAAKRLGLLREMVPAAARVAVLVSPSSAVTSESTVRDTSAGARAMGLQVHVLNADTSHEIDAEFRSVLFSLVRFFALRFGCTLSLLIKGPPVSTLPRHHIASDVCESHFRRATWTPRWSLLSGSGFPLRLLHVSTRQRNAGIMCCTKSDALQQFLGRSEPVVLGAVFGGVRAQEALTFWHQDGVGGPGWQALRRRKKISGASPRDSFVASNNFAGPLSVAAA
jgi:ABC transporter substrate binding protein